MPGNTSSLIGFSGIGASVLFAPDRQTFNLRWDTTLARLDRRQVHLAKMEVIKKPSALTIVLDLPASFSLHHLLKLGRKN
jgi:hypothetical protein